MLQNFLRLRPAFSLLATLLLTAIAHAQSVHWEAGDSSVGSSLQLVFEECTPDGAPQLPALPGVTFTKTGESSSTSIINFSMTRSVLLTYVVRGRTGGALQIPAFTVKTDKGPLRVAAFNAAAPAAPLESIASSTLVPERTAVWAGEVFGLTYTLSVSGRNNPQLASNPDWNAAPLVVEDWPKTPEQAQSRAGADRRTDVIYATRALARSPGAMRPEAVNQLINIQTGTVGFGLFTQARMEQVSVTSTQPTIEVRPLPPAPAGFAAAVGQFKLVSKIIPEKAAVGEPITWTLELSGTGNWPDLAGLPQRDVSKDFQVVQPQAKRTPVEGKLFDVTLAEDVVLVPTKAGAYVLGPVTFTYFDPKSGGYKTLSTPRTSVTVTAPQPIGTQLAETGKENSPAPAPADSAQSKSQNLNSKIPSPPAALPRDPLPGTALAPVPLALAALLPWLLAPAAALLLLWLALAARRAQRADPLRPRREARARLTATLAQLENAPAAGRTALLLAWQHDVAVLFQIPHAAPPATALADAAWRQLWAESDRALYGEPTTLPHDWLARALVALAARRVPGFNPLRTLLPRSLFPFVALLALALAVPSLRAQDGAVAYRRADFPAAEKAWRASVAQHPTDAIARHNLSLALAQQDQWGEAAAHAAAAFVQSPASEPMRAQLALACEKAGFVPAPFAPFLQQSPLHDALARRASPSVWQRWLVASTALAAVACALLLLGAYGWRPRGLAIFSGTLLIVSLALAASTTAGWLAYGAAADMRAAITWRAGTLRSIPTEADTAQKTVALAAGSVANADRTFLGWVRLTFDNGQTGWVRQEEIIPLWR